MYTYRCNNNIPPAIRHEWSKTMRSLVPWSIGNAEWPLVAESADASLDTGEGATASAYSTRCDRALRSSVRMSILVNSIAESQRLLTR